MNPRFICKDQMILAGVSFYGDPFASSAAWTEENEIGRLWARFTKHCQEHAETLPPSAISGIGYEMHLWNDDTLDTGHYEVFIGVEIAEIADVPIELCVKTLPPADYAVFTVKGELMLAELDEEITESLENAGKRRSGTFIINVYDHRYLGLERVEDSEIDIYVPVQ